MALRRQLRRRSAASVSAALANGGLLQALRSEIDHEASLSVSDASDSQVGRSVGGFTVEWDDPRAQDVVLRRRDCGPKGEEEVAVSAILEPLRFQEDFPLPRHVLMKVCVKKPDVDPVLQFDCRVFRRGDQEGSSSEFAVRSAYYYLSLALVGASKYRGPSFRLLTCVGPSKTSRNSWTLLDTFCSLDPQLQGILKEYLIERGIGAELNNFLLRHLPSKENMQYMNWLCALERSIKKSA